MNAIVNMFMADKFMPEMLLRQPILTYTACGPFTKNNEKIKKIKETGDSRYIYQNELDKLVFSMTWPMEIRTAADKVLRDKAFNIMDIIMMDIIVGLL